MAIQFYSSMNIYHLILTFLNLYFVGGLKSGPSSNKRGKERGLKEERKGREGEDERKGKGK